MRIGCGEHFFHDLNECPRRQRENRLRVLRLRLAQRCVEFIAPAAKPERQQCHLQVPGRLLGNLELVARVGIPQDRHTVGTGHCLHQKLQALCCGLHVLQVKTRDVAARPREAGDQVSFDRIEIVRNHDDRRSSRRAAHGRDDLLRPGCKHNIGPASGQGSSEFARLIDLPCHRIPCHHEIRAIDVAQFTQALLEREIERCRAALAPAGEDRQLELAPRRLRGSTRDCKCPGRPVAASPLPYLHRTRIRFEKEIIRSPWSLAAAGTAAP